jgi:hypothetical protein
LMIMVGFGSRQFTHQTAYQRHGTRGTSIWVNPNELTIGPACRLRQACSSSGASCPRRCAGRCAAPLDREVRSNVLLEESGRSFHSIGGIKPSSGPSCRAFRPFTGNDSTLSISPIDDDKNSVGIGRRRGRFLAPGS